VEPLTRGLLPLDPRSLCPLSSAEFVVGGPPPPQKKKIPGYTTGINEYECEFECECEYEYESEEFRAVAFHNLFTFCHVSYVFTCPYLFLNL
jgi:hypothetical protein